MGKTNITLEMERKKGDIVYTITLHGHGSVVYKSGDHVKMKDISEIPINKKDFIDLLTDFENYTFPSENMIYKVDDDSEDDYTYVSFSIRHGKNEFEEKEIKHYNTDERVSQKLKDLEDKIDSLTKSKKWLKEISSDDLKKVEKIPVKKPLKKIESIGKVKEKSSFSFLKNISLSPKLLIMTIVVIAIVVLLIVFLPSFIDSEDSPKAYISISASNISGDNPLMIVFDTSFEDFDESIVYSWDFGDGVNSSMQETSHTYLEPGNYTVILTVSDNKGNKASDSLDITID